MNEKRDMWRWVEHLITVSCHTFFLPHLILLILLYFLSPSAPLIFSPPLLRPGPPLLSHLPQPPHFSAVLQSSVLLSSSPTPYFLCWKTTSPALIQTSLTDLNTPLTPLKPCCLFSSPHFLSLFTIHLGSENFKWVSFKGASVSHIDFLRARVCVSLLSVCL